MPANASPSTRRSSTSVSFFGIIDCLGLVLARAEPQCTHGHELAGPHCAGSGEAEPSGGEHEGSRLDDGGGDKDAVESKHGLVEGHELPRVRE